MQKIAKSRGGECLSSHKSISLKTSLRYKCGSGHVWQTRVDNTLQGKWCPYCSIHYAEEKCRFVLESLTGMPFPKSRPSILQGLELDGYNSELRFAFEYHGRQHYEYVSFYNADLLSFQKQQQRDQVKIDLCNHYNILLFEIPHWESKTDKRLMSFVLRYMYDNKIHLKNNTVVFEDYYKNCLPLRKMQQIAKQRGGKCVSDYYYGSSVHLQWECANKHKWYAIPSSIKQGSWCPRCGYASVLRKKFTIDDMRAIAAKKQGECLSKKYKGCHTPVLWQCKYQYKWLARPSNIMRGQWCPKCSIEKSRRARMKYSIEDMYVMAKQKGGKCLSAEYQGCLERLGWKCGICKHEWEATPSSVRAGNWCAKCTNKKRAKSKIDYDHEKIIKLYREGKNFSEISRDIGCNKSTVRLVCRKNENVRRI